MPQNRSFVLGLCLVGLAVTVRPATAQLAVRYEGVNDQSSLISGVLTANFDNVSTSTAVSSVSYSNASTVLKFSASSPGITGLAADIYGGAGGTGVYLGSGRTGTNDTITLNITNSGGTAQQVGYLGLWASAIDQGSTLTFKRTVLGITTTVATLDAYDLNNIIPSGYYGNPNSTGRAGDSTEKFAYLNFYATNTNSQFDTVTFTRSQGGGLEFDNVSVAASATQSNSIDTFAGTANASGFTPVPEPTGVLAAAGGLLGLARRLRRR